MHKIFVSFFGVGFLKPAPGTWGSVAGAFVAFSVLFYFGVTTLFMAAVLLFLISVKIVNEYEEMTVTHDSSHIVIDEVVGVFIAMSMAGAPLLNDQISYLGLILSVLFFRLFDILKPSIIGRIDREMKGGLGVMCDDALAGFFAGLASLMVVGAFLKFDLSHLLF